MEAVDRVIKFLASCGDEDIKAGIGAMNFDSEYFSQFRAGLAQAIEGENEILPYFGDKQVLRIV